MEYNNYTCEERERISRILRVARTQSLNPKEQIITLSKCPSPYREQIIAILEKAAKAGEDLETYFTAVLKIYEDSAKLIPKGMENNLGCPSVQRTIISINGLSKTIKPTVKKELSDKTAEI